MEEQIIKFLGKAEKLKMTFRHNYTTGNRPESAAEHTWRVTLFWMAFQDIFNKDVDTNKVLKMLIIHDLPEIISGDVPHYKQTDEDKKRELQNAKEAFQELPSELANKYFESYKEFEEGETREARFAQAIDKLESQLQVVDSKFSNWENPDLREELLTYPDKAVNKLNDSQITKIWKSIREKIKCDFENKK